jgi:hypothetical protein
VKALSQRHDIDIKEVYSHHQQSRSLDLPIAFGLPSSIVVL